MAAQAPLPQQDDHDLDVLMQRSAEAMSVAGITAQDIIDELPAAGDELMRQWYGDAFIDELVREHAAAQQGLSDPGT